MKKVILLIGTWLLLQDVGAQMKAPVNVPSSKPQKATPAYQVTKVPEVVLYPNPSTGKVFLALSGFKEKTLKVSVVNVIGNLILAENFYETQDHTTKILDLSKCTKGLYYLKLEDESYSAIRKVLLH